MSFNTFLRSLRRGKMLSSPPNQVTLFVNPTESLLQWRVSILRNVAWRLFLVADPSVLTSCQDQTFEFYRIEYYFCSFRGFVDFVETRLIETVNMSQSMHPGESMLAYVVQLKCIFLFWESMLFNTRVNLCWHMLFNWSAFSYFGSQCFSTALLRSTSLEQNNTNNVLSQLISNYLWQT
jgi:hypothetical protein